MKANKKKTRPERDPYVAPSWLAPGPDGKYPINETLTRLDVAFPATVRHLMPDPTTLPSNGRFDGLVATWFFRGLQGAEFIAKPGIDAGKALAHLRCILGSFEPKHEHKEAAISFLLDQWFVDVKVPA